MNALVNKLLLAGDKFMPEMESARLRTLHAKNVLTCQRAFRAYVFTFQRVLHAHVLTCECAFHAYVLTCQHAMRVYVLTCQHVLGPLPHTACVNR